MPNTLVLLLVLLYKQFTVPSEASSSPDFDPATQSPITDVMIMFSDDESLPNGYTLMDKSISGKYAANLNSGTSGMIHKLS